MKRSKSRFTFPGGGCRGLVSLFLAFLGLAFLRCLCPFKCGESLSQDDEKNLKTCRSPVGGCPGSKLLMLAYNGTREKLFHPLVDGRGRMSQKHDEIGAQEASRVGPAGTAFPVGSLQKVKGR
jgi:hypothetical protein